MPLSRFALFTTAVATAFTAASAAFADVPIAEPLPTLANQFAAPPDAYRAHAWWHWLGSNFTKEGITKDLAAMKESGVSGVVVFNAPNWLDPKRNPHPENTYRSEPYWDAFGHALAEAKKLGMTVGIQNSPGWSTTGGPWVTPDYGMQAVIFSKTPVKGPATLDLDLPVPTPNEAKAAPYYKDVAVLAVPVKADATRDDVLDITKHADAAGHLRWNAPAGDWLVYRVGQAPTLVRSHPAPDDVAEHSYEVDKLSRAANVKHWDNVLAPFTQRFPQYIGSTFTHIWIDSYEAGYQNWTPTLRDDFAKQKGYDPLPCILLADSRNESVLEGRGRGLRHPGNNASAATKKFYHDYKQVLSGLFMVGFQTGKEKVNQAGFKFAWEPYVSWGGDPFDTREGAKLADLPVTEFWIHSGEPFAGDTLVKAASAGGRHILGAEAFTGMQATCKFNESPRTLKRSADMGYNYGVNRYYLHTWPHNPFDDKYQPGFAFAHYGTHFSRNQTWFKPGKAFFYYLARCQMLLQQGVFVSRNNDVIHRSSTEAEIFFVRNNGDAKEKTLAFPVSGRTPELWDAYASTISTTSRWKEEDGKTLVTLKLEKDASIFVIFPAKKTTYAKLPEVTVTNESAEPVTGEWQVRFQPKVADPVFTKNFATLASFSTDADPAVKYFSGTATYEKTLNLAAADLAAGKRVVLDLGRLFDIAELEVNGKNVGVLWFPPYKADITAFAKAGANVVKIHVTNNWANRLIGDEQHPEDFEWHNMEGKSYLRAMKGLPDWFLKDQPRPVKERRAFVPWYFFDKNAPLSPAGLLGPVNLLKQDVMPIASH